MSQPDDREDRRVIEAFKKKHAREHFQIYALGGSILAILATSLLLQHFNRQAAQPEPQMLKQDDPRCRDARPGQPFSVKSGGKIYRAVCN